MLERRVEEGLLDVLQENKIGCIAFSPLAKGMLTDRYLHGIPADSRASSNSNFLNPEELTDVVLAKAAKLQSLAQERGQKLSQMALSWVLRSGRVTSALIGSSKVSQIEDAAAAVQACDFTEEELQQIDAILNE